MPQASINTPEILIRVETLDDLFDRLDPSPMSERDLSSAMHSFLSEQLSRSPSSCPAVVAMQAPASLQLDRQTVETAARRHFAREAAAKRLEMFRMIRKSFVLMIAGILIASMLVVLSQWIAVASDSRVLTRVANALSILIWVIMWRPTETLIYDWRPLAETASLYKRLASMTVRLHTI